MMASALLAPPFRRLADQTVCFESPAVATPASLEAFFDGVGRYVDGSESRLLVDARGFRSIDAGGRRVLYRRGAEVRRLRIAVVTSTAIQRAMVTFSALATRTNVRCFPTVEEAQQWLAA